MRKAPDDAATTSWERLALLALGAAALYAVVLVVLRSPLAIQVAAADHVFRLTLVVHVQLAFVFWMLAYGASRWIRAASSGLLPAVGGGGLGLVAVSAFFWGGDSEVLLVNYLPAAGNPAFVAGGLLFLGTVLVVVLAFLGQPKLQRGAQDPTGWLLVAALSLVLAVTVTLSGSGGWASRAWSGGHILQFCYLGLAVEGVWQMLGRPYPKALRLLATVWFGPLLIAVLWATVATDSSPLAFTQLMQWWLWPLPLVAILVMIKGHLAGRPILASGPLLILALLALFVTGCVLGGLIRGDSLLIPAHYHAVLGALTALCLTHLVVRHGLEAGAEARHSMLRLVALYVLGKFVLVGGLLMLWLIGVPRKTPFAGLLEGDGWLLCGTGAVVLGGGMAIASVVLLVGKYVRRSWPGVEVVNGEVEHG